MVKKSSNNRAKEEIVTLPIIEVMTKEKSAGYKADFTTVWTKMDTPLIETL